MDEYTISKSELVNMGHCYAELMAQTFMTGFEIVDTCWRREVQERERPERAEDV
jgi:hypothetical protein